MSEPLRIRVTPQDIGYPEITVPEPLRVPLETAERADTPEGWDALHLACVSHAFPRPAFTPAWEEAYAAVAYLSKLAVVMMRVALLRRAFAARAVSAFDADTPDGASF